MAVGVLVGCAGKSSDLPPADDPAGLDVEGPQGHAEDPVGSIQVLTNQPTKIMIDGKPSGEAPVTVDNILEGTHDVTFIDEVHGNVTMQVEVIAGQTSAVSYNPPPKATEHGE